jgi:N-acetylmuramoyl-L-alanine amidase
MLSDLLPVRQDFLTNKVTRPALRDPAKYQLRKVSAVVVHWTANERRGADAAANRNYFQITNRFASAHYIADDKEVVQCLPEREVGYHCGDRAWGGGYKTAGRALIEGFRGLTPNFFTLGLEMCINSDGDWAKTCRNSAALLAWILYRHGLELKSLLRHFDVTGKLCPRPFIDEGDWSGFVAQVGANLRVLKGAALATRTVTAKGLNVRTGPGTLYPVAAVLGAGDKVVVFEQTGDWVKVGPDRWLNGLLTT